MIWIAGTILAYVFVKLGALLVMVKLLALCLAVALLTNVVLAVTLIWRKGLFGRLFGRKSLTDPQ